MDDLRRDIVAAVPSLRRYARALLREPADADDLVQDCLTRAIDRLHLWTPGTNLRAWLFTILHNQHVNTARRRARRPDGIAMNDSGVEPAAGLAAQEDRHALRDMDRALAALDEDQRQAVLLIGLEGLTYGEAADVLDVPLGTVMSRLSRGRRRLRDLMDQGHPPALRRIK